MSHESFTEIGMMEVGESYQQPCEEVVDRVDEERARSDGNKRGTQKQQHRA